MSSTIGKLSVWSAASVSDVPPPPPPQATATHNAPNAAARERNLELRVIEPPHGKQMRGGAQKSHPRNPSPSSRQPGARVRRRRTPPSLDGPATPRSILGLDTPAGQVPGLAGRRPASRVVG